MKYFISFSSIASGIRVKRTLSHENFILFSSFNKHKLLLDNSIQSLVIAIEENDKDKAYIKANQEKNKISAYLAGIFQKTFFFTDHLVDYEIYNTNPVPDWESLKLPSTKPVSCGWPRSYGIIFHKNKTIVIDKIPDFSKYKQYESIFYMWRSATDSFNELGWRFLNFFRIIEKITGKQRGKEGKSKEMYQVFSIDIKTLISEQAFIDIANKWANPSAHGQMPNSVIPSTPHGNYEEHPDILKLFILVGKLIKEHLECKN